MSNHSTFFTKRKKHATKNGTGGESSVDAEDVPGGKSITRLNFGFGWLIKNLLTKWVPFLTKKHFCDYKRMGCSLTKTEVD